MRIDKFLKNSRLIKRRTVAKEACEKERVFRDGRAMKPSDEVKVGDIIELKFGNSEVKIKRKKMHKKCMKICKSIEKLYLLLYNLC